MLVFALIYNLLRWLDSLPNYLCLQNTFTYLRRDLNGEELFVNKQDYVQVVLDGFLQFLLSIWLETAMGRMLYLNSASKAGSLMKYICT